MNMFKSNGGFTLVELIVVIAILAILAGAAIPAYSGYISRANDSTVLAELEAVETAAFAAAALKGETPVKITVAPAPEDPDAEGAIAAGTIIAYIADADGVTGDDTDKDNDAVYDVLVITEFYDGTVDLSKHSKYAEAGCTWYAENQKDSETLEKVINPEYDAKTNNGVSEKSFGVKGWNIGIGAKE